jgi:Xaa-Pro aminopeptidase
MLLQQEKLEQAISILEETNTDAWLIFARETEETPERSWELLAPGMATWQSALILTARGDRIAIVGNFDEDTYSHSGLFTNVYSYTESIRDVLRDTLVKINPGKIALNFSKSNPSADGLSYGMYLLLRDYLEGTPYLDRISSADPIVSRLRGRKTAEEISRVRAAINRTVELFGEVSGWLKPGVTERAVAAQFHQRLEEWELTPAWEWEQCPIVNTGPHSSVGHAGPSDLKIEPGHLVHIDFGIKQNEYCSDLQRMWYVARAGESRAPQQLQRAFEAVRKTIEESAKILKPGAIGWQVDAHARQVIMGAGFPEYQHALGHQLGRTVHDGSTLLGPRWERYGDTPYGVVEENQIYTIELGVPTDAGYVGLEEDVLVTANGAEWLAEPQVELTRVSG